MKDILIVFPSESQIKFLGNYEPEISATVYIILQKESESSIKSNNKIIVLSKAASDKIEQLKERHMIVLCCHEEAIYWLHKNMSLLWQLQFAIHYLDLLEKKKFKDYLNCRQVHNTTYSLRPNDISSYPAIAKPSFGFGSVGVCMVKNQPEAEEYISNFQSMIQDSVISNYQNKYFPETTNHPIFEKALLGKFYRTPLVFENGKCKYAFPIQGISRPNKKYSEYHWEEFELNLNDTTINFKQIEEIINQLGIIFSLSNGIYVAEFIQENNGTVSLLEFSPRQTSDRISHMVYLSTGIDLEIETLLMFLQNEAMVKPISIKNARIVRMRLESTTNFLPPLPAEYRLIETEPCKSLYENKIQLKYYIKDGEGNE